MNALQLVTCILNENRILLVALVYNKRILLVITLSTWKWAKNAWSSFMKIGKEPGHANQIQLYQFIINLIINLHLVNSKCNYTNQ